MKKLFVQYNTHSMQKDHILIGLTILLLTAGLFMLYKEVNDLKESMGLPGKIKIEPEEDETSEEEDVVFVDETDSAPALG